MVNVIIGERIKKIREEKKITREALAGKAGISTKFLYEIENGKKGISAETVLKIANALSCSCDLILKGEDLENEKKVIADKIIKKFEPKQIKKINEIIKLISEVSDID